MPPHSRLRPARKEGGGEETETAAVAEPSPTEPESNSGTGPEAENGAEDQLPPLEELTRRIPPEVIAALDELFRARWTGVRRLRPGDLTDD